MNQTFDFQRILLVIRLEIAQKGRNQLMMAALMFGLLLAMMLPVTFVREYSGFLASLQAFAFVLLLIFGMSLYTNQVFSNYATPSSGMAAIMVPASHFEKWLSVLVLNLLFVFSLYCLFAFLHHWTFEYANANLLSGEREYKPFPLYLFDGMIAIYLLIQGASFLGSIYFTKASYIKTAAAVLILGFGAYFGYQGLANLVTPPGYEPTTNLFGNWHMVNYTTGNYYKVNFPAGLKYLAYFMSSLLIPAIWYAAYLRLKEKEI